MGVAAWTQKKALTISRVTQTLEVQLIRLNNEPGVGHGTHLTVYWGYDIKADHIENHGYKGGQARSRVSL